MPDITTQDIIAQIQADHTICEAVGTTVFKSRHNIMALVASIRISEEHTNRIKENIQRYTDIYQELEEDEQNINNNPEQLEFFQAACTEIEIRVNATNRAFAEEMNKLNDTESEAIIQWHQNHLYVESAARAANSIAAIGMSNSNSRERSAIRQELMAMVQKAEAALETITDNPPLVITARRHRFRSMINDTRDRIHQMRRDAESVIEETA